MYHRSNYVHKKLVHVHCKKLTTEWLILECHYYQYGLTFWTMLCWSQLISNVPVVCLIGWHETLSSVLLCNYLPTDVATLHSNTIKRLLYSYVNNYLVNWYFMLTWLHAPTYLAAYQTCTYSNWRIPHTNMNGNIQCACMHVCNMYMVVIFAVMLFVFARNYYIWITNTV